MITLQERLQLVSEMENEGCDETTIQALMECLDGNCLVYDKLTPEIIEELVNA